MPFSGLCFGGGAPGVVKRAGYYAIDRSLAETSFCVVPPANHSRVAEKLSLDLFVSFCIKAKRKEKITLI
jgi:hypothetical protein